MGKSSKPRKPYVRGRVLAGGHLPLVRSKADLYETKVLMSMAGLAQGFLTYEQAVELALFVTACSHTPELTPTEIAAVTMATKALSDVHSRFERTKKWGASGDELRMLRESLPLLVAYFRKLPSAMVVDATLAASKRFF